MAPWVSLQWVIVVLPGHSHLLIIITCCEDSVPWWHTFISLFELLIIRVKTTVLPAKSDGDVVFCLQLLSKTSTCTLHLCFREFIDNLCINPVLRKGLIH